LIEIKDSGRAIGEAVGICPASGQWARWPTLIGCFRRCRSLLGPAGAQQMRMEPMPGMMAGGGAAAAGGAGYPMMQAVNQMNKAMAAVPMTGTDRDFVAMMIPHHQGAIDKARVGLNSGKDPFLRKLARNLIAAQEREIHEMKAWQGRHPAKQ
jgi:uncharacterized protein (DUF305 family)